MGTTWNHFLIIRCGSRLAKPHVANECKEGICPLFSSPPLRIVHEIFGLEALYVSRIDSSVKRKGNDDAFPPENFEGHQII